MLYRGKSIFFGTVWCVVGFDIVTLLLNIMLQITEPKVCCIVAIANEITARLSHDCSEGGSDF